MLKKSFAAFVLVPCLLATSALATTLAPGGYVGPLPLLPDGTNIGTQLAAAQTDLDGSGTGFDFGVFHLQSAVYRDGSGKLTFTYLVLPPFSMPPNSGVSVTGFQGFAIDAFDEDNGANLLAPGMATRTADGDEVTFGFPLGTRNQSALYVLKTDATDYDRSGNTRFVFASDVAGTEPLVFTAGDVIVPEALTSTGPVPEPAALGALGAVAGFGIFTRRMRNRAQR